MSHPFVDFRKKYGIDDETNSRLAVVLGDLAERELQGGLTVQEVADELWAVLPAHKGNVAFCEELMGSWENHQFDSLRDFLRRNGWKC